MAHTWNQFGKNPNVVPGTAADLWSAGGFYPFPSAASATTISSSSASDSGVSAGSGARTVTIFGLDASYKSVEETVTLDGLNPVTLATPLLRVNRMYVATAGATGLNEGLIQLQHAPTTISEIPPGEGQTSACVFTIGADSDRNGFAETVSAMIVAWGFYSYNDKEPSAHCSLMVRPPGGAWRTVASNITAGNYTQLFSPDHTYELGVFIEPGTDIRIVCNDVLSNKAAVVGGHFDLVIY